MTTLLSACSPAKLNLFLHVTGRRPDGYHTLQTVFQLLDWGDDMTFQRSDLPGVQLTPAIPGVSDEANLILRAARQLLGPDDGVAISVTKRIPMGAGLGGGSSNAATTLLALNQLFDCGLDSDALAALGRELGADVPVFVRGRSAWAEGVGEVLTPIALPERWYVIVTPACSVSTAEIFAAPELTRHTPAITISAFFAGQTRNDLQPVVVARYPEVHNALNWLDKRLNTALTPAAGARMTGSGASVFAAVESEAQARAIVASAPLGLHAVAARGVQTRPAFSQSQR